MHILLISQVQVKTAKSDCYLYMSNNNLLKSE